MYTEAEISSLGGTQENVNLSVLFSQPEDAKAFDTAMRNYQFAPDISSTDNLWEQGYKALLLESDFSTAVSQ